MNIEVGKKYQNINDTKEIIEVLFIANRGDEPIFTVNDEEVTVGYSRKQMGINFKPYEEPEEKKLEQRIKEAYPDYGVKVCEWSTVNNWCYKSMSGSLKAHFAAISKRGFYGYVYENKLGALYVSNNPFGGKLPLACLFEEATND